MGPWESATKGLFNKHGYPHKLNTLRQPLTQKIKVKYTSVYMVNLKKGNSPRPHPICPLEEMYYCKRKIVYIRISHN